MFQIKDFVSITASMINLMRASTKKITDFNVGSVARTLIEAPASELDQLYQEMFHGLKEAIPVATYNTFEFPLLPASAATGVLTFYATGGHSEDILIATGTLVKNPTTNKVYRTIRDVFLEVGDPQVSVAGVADTVGADTNCDANTILVLIGSITGIAGVSNLTAFSGGRDIETDDERKLRFQGFISTLQRGTLAAIRYGASTAVVTDVNGIIIERVVFIGIVEPYEVDPIANDPGYVEVYVHNGVGGTSPTLVDNVQLIIDGYYDEDGVPVPGWKAAGVVVDCFAATEVLQAVTGSVYFLPGYQSATVLAECTTVVRAYLLSLKVGEKSVKNEIVERIMAVPGVYNLVLAAPTADLAPIASEKIMPGVVTLTAGV
jgi:uncharacterized phage protein gp47/JayE